MASMKPILVTGSHRSGTTWVGSMIAASPSVAYIHEPFNIDYPLGRGMCGAKFVYWFTYITDENEAFFYNHIRNTIEVEKFVYWSTHVTNESEAFFYKHIRNRIELRYNLIGELKGIKSLKDIKRILKEYKRFSTYRFRNLTPLIKDPIAMFSAEWLAKRFDMNVLILIRHPAAFASSLKMLNWTYPFSHFLQQPHLMRDHLYPFETEITEYANNDHNINLIDQAILLWKIIHYMIIKYQNTHRDWIFLRHEDISQAPLHHFQSLFTKFGLKFSRHVQRLIQEHSAPSNPSEAATDCIKRDSKANIWNWKNRLTKSEIKRIRERVEVISKEFYSDSDW